MILVTIRSGMLHVYRSRSLIGWKDFAFDAKLDNTGSGSRVQIMINWTSYIFMSLFIEKESLKTCFESK